ncbi:ketopantoate reductase PanE/ApbA C terminal-domain-containing protein [Crepidotus variabilis]|uniref:2-dehydropantoate 2-reductase n=1 Tax=Crepidotus variabilis TaxID=179855 RepID=A0A9P6JWH8_9AGAR|nr:ketopantoate reductase PanE/ApbA C terminal-domain-containing protein [Crepidotus variabilis]
MHFHILGIGSIGSLVAHHLRRVLPIGHSIGLIHKTNQDRERLLQKGSLSLERAGATDESRGFHHEVYHEDSISPTPPPGSPPPLPTPPSETVVKDASKIPIDSLLVTLKAHQTVHAIKVLGPRISSNSTIVLLQNGMGVYEKLLKEVFLNPSQRPHFILASNTHGAYATGFHKVVHAGVGAIDLGIAPDSQGRDFEAGMYDNEIDPRNRQLRLSDLSPSGDQHASRYRSLRATIAALLLLEPLNTSWKPFYDVQVNIRRKLAVNAVINPLTALLDCRNGDIHDHQPARALMKQICDEASAVYEAQMTAETQTWLAELKAQGIKTMGVPLPPFPEALTSQSLQDEVLRVAAITRRNISSTLQDVRKGRHTEIMYINGYLRELGIEYDVPTPVNTTLADLIHMKYLLPLNIL